MSLPTVWTQVPVQGQFLNMLGAFCAGRVIFRSSQPVVVGGMVVLPQAIEYTLDAQGRLPAGATLPSTNDADITPGGWAYTVTEDISNHRPDYQILVPFNAAFVDLATVVPVYTGPVLNAGSDALAIAAAVKADVYNSVGVYSKNQSVTPVVLSSAAVVPVQASASNNFQLTLDQNAVLANPSQLTNGMVLNFAIKQDAAGSRTLSFGSAYKFAGGTAPVLSTTPNAIDFMSCYFNASASSLLCNLTKGYA